MKSENNFIYNCIKIIKYLRINSTNAMQLIQCNLQTLLKEIKDKWIERYCMFMNLPKKSKLSLLQKLTKRSENSTGNVSKRECTKQNKRIWKNVTVSYTASGNIKWCNCFGQQLLKKLPYDPEIPFLDIYPR